MIDCPTRFCCLWAHWYNYNTIFVIYACFYVYIHYPYVPYRHICKLKKVLSDRKPSKLNETDILRYRYIHHHQCHILILKKVKKKQHRTFPGSLPAQYLWGPRLLKCQVRNGAGCLQPGMAASKVWTFYYIIIVNISKYILKSGRKVTEYFDQMWHIWPPINHMSLFVNYWNICYWFSFIYDVDQKCHFLLSVCYRH